MKLSAKWIVVGVFAVLTVSECALAQNEPTLQPISVGVTYIPTGFDSNDNVQVTVEGYFPNTCYKVGPTKAKLIDGQVIVQQQAYKYGGICLQMIVPFHKTIDVGIMKAGQYKVIDSVSEKAIGDLPITVAKSPEADDHLYAPISNAFIFNNEHGFGVTVTGVVASRCIYIREMLTKTTGNVIEVLPIMDEQRSTPCGINGMGQYMFEKSVTFPKPATGRYLLHVRSLEGHAVNQLVDVD